MAIKAAGRKAGHRKPNSRRRRSNPDELAAAAKVYESFHGKPATSARTVEELHAERDTLAELGRLVSLEVEREGDRRRFVLDFRGVTLACSPDGGQLYFVGGDQALDLAALGLSKSLPKDHITVGRAVQITYHTRKGFHNFEGVDYYHRLGEKGGTPPLLQYDTLNKRLYVTGGTYQVRPEGIVK